MVKKKGQKNAQSKKKLDLAAAVEAAEQGEEESDLSKLKLNSEDPLAASAAKTKNGNMDDDEAATGNEEEEEDTLVMNYNPPEEGPATEETGKKVNLTNLCTRDHKTVLPAFVSHGAIRFRPVYRSQNSTPF